MDPADLILAKGADAWREAIREADDIVTFLFDTLAKHIPKKERFVTVAEATVLPFIREVQSPTQRDRYVQKAAHVLGVSERAVEEAIAKLPRTPEERLPERTEPERANVDERARSAYALLLWIESQSAPLLDAPAFARELEKAIGTNVLAALRALPASERERLRFAAERLWGASRGLRAEAATLLSVLARERLTRELGAATQELRRAEARKDEAEVDALMARCAELTGEIARLSK
jgi:DNA primase